MLPGKSMCRNEKGQRYILLNQNAPFPSSISQIMDKYLHKRCSSHHTPLHT